MTPRSVVSCALLLVLTAPAAARACASYLEDIGFWPSRRPAAEVERYVAGELGVLDRRFGRYYLFVAYRYLAGIGLTDVDRGNLTELLSAGPTMAPDVSPQRRWLEARNAIAGTEEKRWLSVEKSERIERDGETIYRFYVNCLDDAFSTAATTLEFYLRRFSPESPEVHAWLEAQDMVFANCAGSAAIPEPLETTRHPRLRADRSYQIAAAQFYAGRYEAARRSFEAIAADPASPWRETARYLVGRTYLRENRLEEAQSAFLELSEGLQRAELRRSAQGLYEHARYRGEPDERRRELLPDLLSAPLGDRAGQEMIDFFRLLEPPHELASLGSELAEWVRVVGWPTEAGRSLALERWQSTQSLRWLVAALILAEASTPQAEELIRAGAAVPEDSPAYVAVNYHRYRLLAGQGRLDALRGELDQLLETAELAAADRNRFQTLRARVALDLDEYCERAQQVPFELVYDGGASRVEAHLGHVPEWLPGQKLLRPELVEVMNRGLRTAEIVDLVRRGVVAPELRRRVILAAWTRALVLGDDDAARAAAPLVRELEPALAGELQTWEAAGDDEREFVTALTLLRFPGLHPDVHSSGRDTPLGEIDSLRANWWCPGTDFWSDEPPPWPAFVDPDRAAAERARLRGLEAGPHHLGRIVVEWADHRPEDPRLPEALHRVVKATRFACPLPGGGGYGAISRPAFERLHQRYPDSPWTAQTPHWFD